MAMPQAPGFPPAEPPRVTRSRAGGIMLALGGVATLVCVFVLPWERVLDFDSFTLWEIRQELAEAQAAAVFSAGESVSYQVPVFTAVAAGLLALLAGGLAAAVGARATNVLATLAGLLASFLALFSPVYYFFRGSWDLDDLDFFLTEVAGLGYFLIYPVSVFLFVATIIAFVGVFRAGRTAGPRPPAYPAQPQQPAAYPPPPAGQPIPPQQPPAYQQPPPYQP